MSRLKAEELFYTSGGKNFNEIIDLVESLPCSRIIKNKIIYGCSLSESNVKKKIETDIIPYMHLEYSNIQNLSICWIAQKEMILH